MRTSIPGKLLYSSLFSLLWVIDIILPANAALLISPSGGTPLFVNADFDSDGTIDIKPAGFGGQFYGQSVGAIFVTENGNLNFSNNGGYFPLPWTGPSGTARIAPLWDDVALLSMTDNAVINHSLPGKYLAVTWQNVRILNDLPDIGPFPPSDRSFQVVWFEQDSVIKGAAFKKDDIVFTYVGRQAGTTDFGNINAVVGVTNGTAFTPLPGDADGFVQSGQTDLLAWEHNTYLRFRPTVDGANGFGYDAAKLQLTAVPEPSIVVVASLATAIVGFRSVRRRRSQRVV